MSAEISLRVAAILCWFTAIGFGYPNLPAMWSLLNGRGVPLLFGFPAYGGGTFERFGITTSVPLLGAILLVCVLRALRAGSYRRDSRAARSSHWQCSPSAPCSGSASHCQLHLLSRSSAPHSSCSTGRASSSHGGLSSCDDPRRATYAFDATPCDVVRSGDRFDHRGMRRRKASRRPPTNGSTPTPRERESVTPTSPATPSPTATAPPSGLLAMTFTDVRSGETFNLAQFEGKVTIVQHMAVW